MEKEPICEFETPFDLTRCVEYWKDVLFLNDWIIKVSIIPLKDFDIPDRSGENNLNFEQKIADIKIMEARDDDKNSIVKYCQEKILVHELLHCKYNFMEYSDTYEQKFIDIIEHQQLDDLAKSLIMIKYGISLEWFCK